jgi:hypothetical protein
MLSRKRNLIFLVLAALVIVGVGLTCLSQRHPKKPAVIPLGDYDYTITYAESRISQVMKEKHLPGFAVVLVDDQNIIWQETFGLANLEEDQPVEADTVFRLWSVSKAFTALEILRLVEDGLVDLDTPITTYLPEFSMQSRSPFVAFSPTVPACRAMNATRLTSIPTCSPTWRLRWKNVTRLTRLVIVTITAT